MVNQVIDGMAEAINKAFGDEYEIHSEAIMQDVIPKTFSVRCLDSHIDRFLGERFKRTCLMEVNYFPESELDPRAEIQGVVEPLFDALEVIKVANGKVRGVQADFKIVDNVLVYVLKYVFYVLRIEGKEYMDSLTTEIMAREAGDG